MIKTLKEVRFEFVFPFGVNSKRGCWSDQDILSVAEKEEEEEESNAPKGKEAWCNVTLKWTHVLLSFLFWS